MGRFFTILILTKVFFLLITYCFEIRLQRYKFKSQNCNGFVNNTACKTLQIPLSKPFIQNFAVGMQICNCEQIVYIEKFVEIR